MKFIRKHLSTFLVALVTAAVTAGAPALAHGVRHALFSHNSDKVDGKHAVGSGASISSRRGKLVATNGSTGRLPNNIIAQAPDSAKLGGSPASDYVKNGDSFPWGQLTGIPADVGALGAGTPLGNAVTAPDFLYSQAKNGSVFADPTHCERGVGFAAPYGAVHVFHPPANNLGPAVGLDTAAAGDYDFYCPIPIQVPAGASLSITGGDVQFLDYGAGCLAAAHIRTKTFGGVSGGTTHGSAFSGSDGNDFAFVSGDAFGRVDKSWSAVNIGISSTTVPFILATIRNDGSSNSCRYNGAIINYTVDRP